jgi:3-hydroxybutyryl-CoA dehydratase
MLKGDTFSQEFIIDKEIYNGFINLFRDENPLHTDVSFAKKKGFVSIVMHGNILGGFISYFIGECLPIKGVIIHSQEIKYYNPVFLNDRLFFIAKVSDVFESVSVVAFDFLFENEHKQKIANGKIQIGLI